VIDCPPGYLHECFYCICAPLPKVIVLRVAMIEAFEAVQCTLIVWMDVVDFLMGPMTYDERLKPSDVVAMQVIWQSRLQRGS